MKFVLNENFILEETKYVLEERYYLAEAANSETIKDNAIATLKEIEGQLKLAGGLDDDTNELTEIKKFAAAKLNSSTADSIPNLIKLLNDNYKGGIDGAKDVELGGKSNVAHSYIALSRKDSGIDRSELDNIWTKVINEVKSAADELLTTLKTSAKNADTLSKLYKTLAFAVEDVETELRMLGKVQNKNSSSNLIEVKDKNELNWEELFDKAAKKEKFAIKIRSYNKTWKTYNIADVSDIHKAYAVIEWGEEFAQDILNLGIAFWQEVLKLGFSKTTNPFINFLKNIFVPGGKVYDIKTDAYSALHNAYLDHTIKALLENGLKKDSISNSDIIYNAYLYSLPGGQAFNIIKAYYGLRALGNEKLISTLNDNAEKIGELLNISKEEFNNLSNLAKLNSLFKENNFEDMYSGQLRPYKLIDQLYALVTSSSIISRKRITDTDIEQIIADIKPSIESNRESGQKYIKYILTSTAETAEIADTIIKELSSKYGLNLINYSDDDMVTIKNKLQLNKRILNADKILKLISEIGAISGLAAKETTEG